MRRCGIGLTKWIYALVFPKGFLKCHSIIVRLTFNFRFPKVSDARRPHREGETLRCARC